MKTTETLSFLASCFASLDTIRGDLDRLDSDDITEDESRAMRQVASSIHTAMCLVDTNTTILRNQLKGVNIERGETDRDESKWFKAWGLGKGLTKYQAYLMWNTFCLTDQSIEKRISPADHQELEDIFLDWAESMGRIEQYRGLERKDIELANMVLDACRSREQEKQDAHEDAGVTKQQIAAVRALCPDPEQYLINVMALGAMNPDNREAAIDALRRKRQRQDRGE